uniref:Paired box protein Pax-6-like n=1 Tax=Saccoglossus kowalevskii TaxID=10224 RepID=A0ABM0M7P2_SACKO|nr:PREDICTED: paired box protein Pax-6-like [Saccoglossus kowalevskii]
MPKRVDEDTRKKIIRLFFDGNSLRMVAKEVGLARATVQGIVRHFRRTGWIRSDKSSGCRRLKSTQEIVEFMEFRLLQKPSLTAKEIRMSLLRENICVQENLPSVLEFETMKKFCKSFRNENRIPEARLCEMKEAYELIKALQKRDVINEDNTRFLQALLKKVGRHDLAKRLTKCGM